MIGAGVHLYIYTPLAVDLPFQTLAVDHSLNL